MFSADFEEFLCKNWEAGEEKAEEEIVEEKNLNTKA